MLSLQLRRLVYILAAGLVRIGFLSLLDRLWGESRLTVIAYHRVIDCAGQDFPYYSGGAVPPAIFERQMAFVSQKFNVISLAQLDDFIQCKTSLPPRPLLITFDDGYLDNYLHAYPILKRYGFPAVIFLMTGSISGAVIPWWDRCTFFFKQSRRMLATLPLVGACSLATPLQRTKVCEKLLRTLKTLPEHEKLTILEQIRDRLEVGEPDDCSSLFMTWKQVQEMAQHKIVCQPHSENHPILTRISDEQALAEIRRSSGDIKSHTNNDVVAFAYPNGTRADYDDRVMEHLRSVGCHMAFTMEPGPVSLAQVIAHPLQIPRVYAAHRDTLETFLIKLMGGHPLAIGRRLREVSSRQV